MAVATTAATATTTGAPISSITSTACIGSSRCTISTGTSDPSRLSFSGSSTHSAGARFSSDNRRLDQFHITGAENEDTEGAAAGTAARTRLWRGNPAAGTTTSSGSITVSSKGSIVAAPGSTTAAATAAGSSQQAR